MYKCPVPGCGYIAAYAILNSHARTHGFNKVAEMTKVHGPVTQAKVDPRGLRESSKGTVSYTSGTFNNIDSAMARLVKKDRADLTNR